MKIHVYDWRWVGAFDLGKTESLRIGFNTDVVVLLISQEKQRGMTLSSLVAEIKKQITRRRPGSGEKSISMLRLYGHGNVGHVTVVERVTADTVEKLRPLAAWMQPDGLVEIHSCWVASTAPKLYRPQPPDRVDLWPKGEFKPNQGSLVKEECLRCGHRFTINEPVKNLKCPKCNSDAVRDVERYPMLGWDFMKAFVSVMRVPAIAPLDPQPSAKLTDKHLFHGATLKMFPNGNYVLTVPGRGTLSVEYNR